MVQLQATVADIGSYRGTVFFILKKPAAYTTVKPVESFIGIDPEISAVILEKIADVIITKPVLHRIMLKG
jgi:hypothetical protein